MFGPSNLLEIADGLGCEPDSSWGQLSLEFSGPVDLGSLRRAVEQDQEYGAIYVVATFGSAGEQRTLLLSDGPPEASDLAGVASLASTPTLQDDVLDAGSGWIAAEFLSDQLSEVAVTFNKPNWCHSTDEFLSLASTSWASIGDNISAGPAFIGGFTLELEEAGSVIVPVQPSGDSVVSDDEVAIRRALLSIGDATAWRHIATEEERQGVSVYVRLHRDHSKPMLLDCSNAAGGLELWKWLSETTTANREESLRYILRFLTASSNALPDAIQTRALAERQRIALSRENAVEVQRAISAGQASTTTSLQRARSQFSDLSEDTSKALQATVVASIGVVALVARNSSLLPKWLLLLVAVIASASLAVLIGSRWLRLGDEAAEVELLRESLVGDPLLPASDRDGLVGRIDDFKVSGRRRNNRIVLVSYGALAIVVIWVATIWLLVQDIGGVSTPLVVVEGHLLTVESESLICQSLIGDDPPECAGWELTLIGLDEQLYSMRRKGDVQWTDGIETLTGVVDGETFFIIGAGN